MEQIKNESNEYNFNGKIFTIAFPSFKRHNTLQKLLKQGEEAYENFDNVKEMLKCVFKENTDGLTDEDVSYGQVAGAVQDFFAKSMEMNKR